MYIFIFGFLVFILVVVGLFCQYHSQVIGWKERLVSEMTYHVSSETLNCTNSTHDNAMVLEPKASLKNSQKATSNCYALQNLKQYVFYIEHNTLSLKN